MSGGASSVPGEPKRKLRVLFGREFVLQRSYVYRSGAVDRVERRRRMRERKLSDIAHLFCVTRVLGVAVDGAGNAPQLAKHIKEGSLRILDPDRKVSKEANVDFAMAPNSTRTVPYFIKKKKKPHTPPGSCTKEAVVRLVVSTPSFNT